VGGGTRCLLLLELFEKHMLLESNPKVVAVAENRDNAKGLIKAKEMGIFVTKDYNDFFDRNDIDLIIELTGNQETFYDIILKKKKTVRAINLQSAQLFWEVSKASSIQQETKEGLSKTKPLHDVAVNDLIQEDVIVIDLKYRILDINDTMLKNLGLERDEVIGKTCYEITHHQDFPCSGKKHPCPLNHIVSLKKPFKTTHIHLDKDNNEIFYSISCYPIFDKGKVTGAVEISQDITKEINIQKLMMQQGKLVSIGRLAAGVAHEINNPMTTILTSAILVQEEMDTDDPNYPELKTIVNETLRCRKIVTSLLDFSRQTKPAIKKNDLNDIVRECTVLTRKQAAFNDVLLKLNLADNLPLINVDKDQIQQALINLSLNAIEAASPEGSVTFTTRFLSESGMIEISVSDTGCGIANKNLENIFDPFFTTKKNGTGLGLAITHGIIEQHGGTITVNSKPEQGTRFSIKLPVAMGDENVI